MTSTVSGFTSGFDTNSLTSGCGTGPVSVQARVASVFDRCDQGHWSRFLDESTHTTCLECNGFINTNARSRVVASEIPQEPLSREGLTEQPITFPGTMGQWQVQDSNLRSLQTADLQSDPFGRLGNLPLCSDHMYSPDRRRTNKNTGYTALEKSPCAAARELARGFESRHSAGGQLPWCAWQMQRSTL